MTSIAFPYSIDTVKLLIPVGPETLELFLALRRTEGFDLLKFQSYEKIAAHLWPLHLFHERPESWVPPQFTMESNYMVFKFSLPKLLYGHSACHASALRPALEGLQDLLTSWGVVVTAPWTRWQIRELHISYNFELESAEYAEQVYEQLTRLRYLGKQGYVKGRKQFAWWKGESKTVKFYLKGPEMRERRKDFPAQWLSHHRDSLDKILRYEEEWKGPALIRFCGVESTAECTAARVISSFATTWNQETFLKKVSQRFTHPRPKQTLEDIQRDIRDTYRKAEPICEFAYQVSKLGIRTVKKGMKRSTFFNNQKYLDKIGVKLSHLEHLYDPKWLGDTVDLSGFINPEKIYYGMDGEVIDQGPLYGAWRQVMLDNLMSGKDLIQAV